MITFNIKSFANQVAVFFVIFGFNIIFFTFFTLLTAGMFFGLENLQTAGALRYVSGLSQAGIFGLTALECAFLFGNKNIVNYLQLNTGVSIRQCFFVILIAVVSLPVLSYIIAWNEGVILPQCMSLIEKWMREWEDSAAKTTEILLSGSGVQVLFVNLAVIAVIPAFCEEFLFRGLLISWLKKQISNIHIVVILSACIFSAIHLQFYGFVPRFLLGLYLGYLFVWTGSIWVSILAHFINNAMSVIASYLFNNQYIDTKYQDIGNVGDNYLFIFLSAIFTAVCIYFLYRKKILENT
jgi:membrane protease YdiL (CAAX protease family)